MANGADIVKGLVGMALYATELHGDVAAVLMV